ncbi:hypothetical protein GW17_00039090 [Ensete ventricosum]|uniref:Uncharacterized protein n=1 Tax=Ensete ventricosum TaxID=4639 RepID=A0A444DIY9_ENSVE|nr:hypothetical protein B296_00008436 [Ensete ventricosum]RWV98087.1 hypothetical protein GW17_00039090 [Ensete ventricosum]
MLVLCLPFSVSHAYSEIQKTPLPGGGLRDGYVLPRRYAAEVPPTGNLTVDNSSFILAADRTHRKDPLNGYKRYTGGWNISEQHYWAVSSFFHSSTSKTVDYVVGQANFTVDNLRNFSDSLAEAKKITVDQVFLPANVQSEIDSLKTKVNSSATELRNRTLDNSRKISRVLDRVYDNWPLC